LGSSKPAQVKLVRPCLKNKRTRGSISVTHTHTHTHTPNKHNIKQKPSENFKMHCEATKVILVEHLAAFFQLLPTLFPASEDPVFTVSPEPLCFSSPQPCVPLLQSLCHSLTETLPANMLSVSWLALDICHTSEGATSASWGKGYRGRAWSFQGSLHM
jgi:hypothetical protein